MPHCALDGCGRPCWKGQNYCGKTHARAAGALHDRPALCAFKGCAYECFPGHAYCGKTHARAAGALNDDLTVSRGQHASHGQGTLAAGNMTAALRDSAFDFRGRSQQSEDEARVMALWAKAKDDMIQCGVWEDGMAPMPKAIRAAEDRGFITADQAQNLRDLHEASNSVRHRAAH